jgi:hypothetical protein
MSATDSLHVASYLEVSQQLIAAILRPTTRRKSQPCDRPQEFQEDHVGLGVGPFLVAVGAILAFAVNAVTDVANIQTIGIVLMAVGALGVIIDLIIFTPRRRSGTVADAGYPAEEVVTTTRRSAV